MIDPSAVIILISLTSSVGGAGSPVPPPIELTDLPPVEAGELPIVVDMDPVTMPDAERPVRLAIRLGLDDVCPRARGPPRRRGRAPNW